MRKQVEYEGQSKPEWDAELDLGGGMVLRVRRPGAR